MAKLAGVKLSKAALSHVQVPRQRYDSPLLPDTAVQVGSSSVLAIQQPDALLLHCRKAHVAAYSSVH